MPRPVSLSIDTTLTTAPLGAQLTLSVDNAPTAAAREAFVEQAARTLVGARNNLVYQSIQAAHRQLDRYGDDYDTDPVKRSFAGVDVARQTDGLTITWHWDHEAAAYFEFGTSAHTIHGDPVLVFEFDDSKYDYLAELFPSGTAYLPAVTVSGLPEARFVRHSLHWLRRHIEFP